MAKGKKETAREVAERVVKGAGKVARGVAKRTGGSSGLAKRAKAAKSIQKTGGKATPKMPNVPKMTAADRAKMAEYTKRMSKEKKTYPKLTPPKPPVTPAASANNSNPLFPKLPAKKAPRTSQKDAIASGKKKLEKLDADAKLQEQARRNAARIKRNARNRIRRIEVKENMAKNDGYNSYRENVQGKRKLTKQEQRQAGMDSKKIEGGVRSSYQKQSSEQSRLRDAYKGAKDAKSKRDAKKKLDEHIRKYGRFGK